MGTARGIQGLLDQAARPGRIPSRFAGESPPTLTPAFRRRRKVAAPTNRRRPIVATAGGSLVILLLAVLILGMFS